MKVKCSVCGRVIPKISECNLPGKTILKKCPFCSSFFPYIIEAPKIKKIKPKRKPVNMDFKEVYFENLKRKN